MSLQNPMTALTDLLLGLTGLLMAWRCLAHHRQTGLRRPRWWSLGFAARESVRFCSPSSRFIWRSSTTPGWPR